MYLDNKIYSYNQFKRICYEQGRNLSPKQIYQMYLLTDRWSELRESRLKMDQYKCRMCNDKATCVHHRCYPNIFGEESNCDLTSLCGKCHKNFHFAPSIDEVKKELQERIHKGKTVSCSVCEQICKKYKRKLNSDMSAFLCTLVKLSKKDHWVDIKKIDVRGGDYGKLIHWGFIEHLPNNDSSKKGSGLWRPTQSGIDFAMGKTKAKKHVYLYNNKIMGFSNSLTNVYESLGDKFNYKELMSE